MLGFNSALQTYIAQKKKKKKKKKKERRQKTLQFYKHRNNLDKNLWELDQLCVAKNPLKKHKLNYKTWAISYTDRGGGFLEATSSFSSELSLSPSTVKLLPPFTFCSLLFPHKTLYSPPTKRRPPRRLQIQEDNVCNYGN